MLHYHQESLKNINMALYCMIESLDRMTIDSILYSSNKRLEDIFQVMAFIM